MLGHRSNQTNIRYMGTQPKPVQTTADGHNILHISHRRIRTGRYPLDVVFPFRVTGRTSMFTELEHRGRVPLVSKL
jgi:hypothetical protein